MIIILGGVFLCYKENILPIEFYHYQYKKKKMHPNKKIILNIMKCTDDKLDNIFKSIFRQSMKANLITYDNDEIPLKYQNYAVPIQDSLRNNIIREGSNNTYIITISEQTNIEPDFVQKLVEKSNGDIVHYGKYFDIRKGGVIVPLSKCTKDPFEYSDLNNYLKLNNL
jgi:hypothetical protein